MEIDTFRIIKLYLLMNAINSNQALKHRIHSF